MGVVHLARAPWDDWVAVKVLRPHVAGDATGRARLAREVQTLRRVSGARVAAVLDADVQGQVPYLVTRYVHGPSLDEVVADRGPLEEPALLRLAWGLADALCAIHDAGVVHRDLKPSNVLVEHGEPVVIDFGIAQVADDARLTASGLLIGTPGFLAPEIVAGGVGGPASDLHAWAATVAFAATGRPPFGRGPMEVVLYNVSRGAADLDGIPDSLGPLIRGALAADPQDRISAHELRERLSGLLGATAGQRPATIVLPAEMAATRAFAAPSPTRAFPVAPATRTFTVPPASAYPAPAPGGRWPTASPYGVPPPPAPALGQSQPAHLQPVHLQPARDQPAHLQPARPAEPPAPPRTASPRTRPHPVVSLASLAFLAALGAVAPFIGLISLVAITVLARLVDRAAASFLRRRSAYGRRGTDALVATLAVPWHLLVSVVLGALCLPVVALIAALMLVPVLTLPASQTQATGYAAGAALLAICAWWGPGGGSFRRGSRRIVSTIAPTPLAAGVLASLLGVAALGLALAARSGSFTWSPLDGPPAGWDEAGTVLAWLKDPSWLTR